MISLLALHRRTGRAEYLSTARAIGTFIRQFATTSGLYKGFQGGFDQAETTNPPRRQWSSVEHNLDVHAAFSVMSQVTGEPQWLTDAALAKSFVEAMWDANRECNLAGTDNPNVRNERVGQLPVDVQAWYVLAVRDALTRRPNVLSCGERSHRVNADGFAGFDFNDDRDGVWFEGTGHMATAYTLAARPGMADAYLADLRRAQVAASVEVPGGMWAAPRDGISTGFDAVISPTQSVPFELFRRVHVGATAWHVFATQGVNPYYVR
jgi:hypothetical protein